MTHDHRHEEHAGLPAKHGPRPPKDNADSRRERPKPRKEEVQRSAAENATGDELVVIQRFNDVPDAELARGRLEANGIQAAIFDENMVSAQWLYAQAMGGMRLMVRREDAARAAEVLGLPPIQTEELAKEAGEPEEATCPKCGSSDIRRGLINKFPISCSGLLGLALVYILPTFALPSAVIMAAPWGYRCRSCGYRWGKQKSDLSSSV